ncbi:hypothetical protein JRI60_32645 [Archangium violaceum]|uniref:Hint domain-containing protein n=1 Tax=Archangium violaceum TaxID=83451 RepID=UPI0019512804|nr:Hint domain-containing protein [Archangium violaceum]QRN93889.1 hypothetical protein JRI60_32645 [Archangium violaceum]
MTILGIASQASAVTWAPSEYRCTFDQITNSSQAYGRQRWAQIQANKNLYQLAGKPKDSRFWSPVFTEDANTAYLTYQIYIYPVYVDPRVNYDIWIGPGAAGSQAQVTPSSWTLTGEQLAQLGHLEKPADVLNDGVCEPGCYTPDQQVLFEAGEQSISAAQSIGRADLITLSPDATLDNLTYIANPVATYTLDKDPAKQEILDFHMESGGSLSVTEHHPLVTSEGAVSKAMDFIPGEYLVKQDGTLDKILAIERREWFGKVYNLRPVSRDLTSNILVAQGYLNGSIRYQSEYVEELNRIILRNNVPADLVLGE